MKVILMEAFKVLNDQAKAKELFRQVQDSKVTLETVLKSLKENRKLDEYLGLKESGKSVDKKINQTTTKPQILQFNAV